MLKYLILPLHDNSVPFCHYPGRQEESGKWIAPDILAEGIRFAMLENLNIQFVYPQQAVPQELKEVIDTIDHTDIVPLNHEDEEVRDGAEIIVADSILPLLTQQLSESKSYVVRFPIKTWMEEYGRMQELLPKLSRLNIVLTDVEGKSDAEIAAYGDSLQSLIPLIVKEYDSGHPVQINLLTDRLMLDRMNNCGAGVESITLGPDGNFYVCPAYYGADGESAGKLSAGAVTLPNPQLYRLDHSPICRVCDAFHCRRCVWLNRKLTLEVNTPGREQCLIAHHERNASRILLQELRKFNPDATPAIDIPEIDYLDPFEKINK